MKVFSESEIASITSKHGSPLIVIDREQILEQYRSLQDALPTVDLHYALKPLPHAEVIKALHEQGSFFDLATTGEVALIKKVGIPPERCIHTHPIKRDRDIRAALHYGVTTFVVDNPDEILKFKKYAKRVSLLVRISFRSPNAKVDLSKKFGCEVGAAASLIKQATDLGIKVTGLSFHVGSQAETSAKYVEAIEACAKIFAEFSDLSILDIGGGFPVAYNKSVVPIAEFCAPINVALSKLPKHVRVLAEPGRFIVAPAAIGVSTVMGRAKRDGSWWYYLDDGVYGSYSGQMFDHAKYPITTFKQGPLFKSVLTGPTCDSIDVITDDIMLPELNVGDFVIGHVMGAYTWACATDFNFFKRSKIVVV